MQEALLRDKNGEVVGEDGSKFAPKEKRLNKQDIKKLIDKKMTKVKESLDVDIKLIHKDGKKLQDDIDQKTELMKG